MIVKDACRRGEGTCLETPISRLWSIPRVALQGGNDTIFPSIVESKADAGSILDTLCAGIDQSTSYFRISPCTIHVQLLIVHILTALVLLSALCYRLHDPNIQLPFTRKKQAIIQLGVALKLALVPPGSLLLHVLFPQVVGPIEPGRVAEAIPISLAWICTFLVVLSDQRRCRPHSHIFFICWTVQLVSTLLDWQLAFRNLLLAGNAGHIQHQVHRCGIFTGQRMVA